MEVQGCIYVGVHDMVRKVQEEYPELGAKEWTLIGFLRIVSHESSDERDDGTSYKFRSHEGKTYHTVSHSFIMKSLSAYGLSNYKTLQRSLNLILSVNPPLMEKAYKDNDSFKKLVGYRFTDKANNELFWTGKSMRYNEIPQHLRDDALLEDTDISLPDNELEVNNTLVTFKDSEVTNTFVFPDWFDEQWKRVQTKFPKASQYKASSSTPNKYATTFVIGVLALCKGTFYSTIGKYIKDKSTPVPEELTPEKIVDGILAMPSYDYVKTPAQALIFQSGKYDAGGKCYSPLLKYWEKNGVTGSSTRSQATSTATKPAPKSSGKSVRSNVQYTAEDYKSNKTVMYTYDYIKSYLPNGMVDELIYGDISDYWLKEHPFAKKYDNRLTNFCMDIREAYKDAKKHRPNMSKVLNTLIDMAQFKTKGTDQKWENLFWEYIDQMPIYQDHGLWKWFVERFEHLYGESICDMYNRNKARELEMERASQLRAIEASAFGDYD